MIISDKNARVGTRERLLTDGTEHVHFSLLSQVEPNSFNEAKLDEDWVKVMEEGLNQILTSFLGDGNNDEGNDPMHNINDDKEGNYHHTN